MEGIYGSTEQRLREWGGGDSSDMSSGGSSGDDTESDNEREAVEDVPAEVTALCWSNGGVGVARYLCAECRIEVFEAPVYLVAGEAVRRRSTANASLHTFSNRRGGDVGAGGEGEVRIVVYEDVPPSLLWLVRYLEVHRPQVLLPHHGSEALGDLIALAATAVPLDVVRLSATSAFSAADALPRLAAMYPAQSAELASRFRSEKTAMMRSMAALLQFVAAGQSNVADVVERGVLHALYLEEACAEALQITRTERHPSSAQGRGRAKEGLSLRALLGSALSALGRSMLRQWTALPCCDVAEINARQSVVAFFAHVEHHGVAQQLRTALHGVRSTSHIFTTMRSGRALRKHYVSLHRTIRGVVQVHRLLTAVAHEVPRLFVLLQSIAVEPLTEMANALARTVAGVTVHRADVQNRVRETLPTTAPDTTTECGTRVHICDGVDAALDELRLRLHELRLSLQAKAESAFAQLPWELRARLSLRCAYAVPHGYLLCVPADELVAVVRGFLPPETVDAGHEQSSGAESDDAYMIDGADGAQAEEEAEHAAGGRTGRTAETCAAAPASEAQPADKATAGAQACRFMADAFHWRFHHETHTGDFCFKSAAMEELDTWVGDLQRRVQQRELQVRRDLDTALLYSSLHLLRPTRALGELDCLLSFARVSVQEGWCRPEVVSGGSGAEEEEDGVLEIENGWHPLLSRQLGLQQLIPFSLHLRTSTDRVCVVLGVNGSGKSVLIGAVAHIVFLAHLGCHVPAAAARMSLIEGIFAPSSSACACLAGTRAAATAAAGCGEPTRPRKHAACNDVSHQAVAAQSSFYGECVALHRTLHHVAGQQRVAAATSAVSQTPCDRDAAAAAAGRALVLLDEFGRGTTPEDGCALLKGTLCYFANGGRTLCGSGAVDAATQRSCWQRAPLVLCATHLVEMFKTPCRRSDTVGTSMRRSSGGLPQHMQGGGGAVPLEWVKMYEMEAHTTYAPESLSLAAAEATDRDDTDTAGSAAATSTSRCVPLDVVPTFRAVCVTPQPGLCRWEAWERHAGGILAAGPALGRQCGLDADLLACWASALSVLQNAPCQ